MDHGDEETRNDIHCPLAEMHEGEQYSLQKGKMIIVRKSNLLRIEKHAIHTACTKGFFPQRCTPNIRFGSCTSRTLTYRQTRMKRFFHLLSLVVNKQSQYSAEYACKVLHNELQEGKETVQQISCLTSVHSCLATTSCHSSSYYIIHLTIQPSSLV